MDQRIFSRLHESRFLPFALSPADKCQERAESCVMQQVTKARDIQLSNMRIRVFSFINLLHLVAIVRGWTVQQRLGSSSAVLKMTRTETENPCWQDLYDDDCSMASIAGASFVASKWIKSMPCGAGIEVRIIVGR